MERSQTPSTENEIRFLLSLLRIANPGEAAPEQSQSIAELLLSETNR